MERYESMRWTRLSRRAVVFALTLTMAVCARGIGGDQKSVQTDKAASSAKGGKAETREKAAAKEESEEKKEKRAKEDTSEAAKDRDPATAKESEPSNARPSAAGGRELAPLPDGALPPRTREPPNPATVKFERGKVFLRFGESIVDSESQQRIPDVQVVERYLAEYLRRAGFWIVETIEDAQYRVEGSVQIGFVKHLKAQGRVFGYKVVADAELAVMSPSGELLDALEVPDLHQENVKSEKDAYLQVRRLMASVLWERVSRQSEVLGSPDLYLTLGELSVQPEATEEGQPELTTEAIVQRIAGQGLKVVPVALDALLDTRPVLIASRYPGLTAENRTQLRVYHIADKVLEEVFQKVSRLGLATSSKGRFLVTRGWENEWRKFCPPYRESPNARAKEQPPKKSTAAAAQR